jgi:DNA adenine methylase
VGQNDPQQSAANPSQSAKDIPHLHVACSLLRKQRQRKRLMHYLGGKCRLAKSLASVMPETTCYVEPFVGAGSVLCEMSSPVRCASDANEALIAMWRALQSGWIPPEHVSEAEHRAAKALSDQDPLKAFIGFGVSFAGAWFAGYARGHNANYAGTARKSLLKKIDRCRDVCFEHRHYDKAWYPEAGVVYCDAPYRNTTQYSAVGAFDTGSFWRFARDLSTKHRQVFVSEYSAPEGWTSVWSKAVKTGVRGAQGCMDRQEHLWAFG